MTDSNEQKPKIEIAGDWKSEVQAEKQRLAEEKAAQEPAIKGDDDWKAEAKAEKERLAAKAEEEDASGGGAGRMPPADFKTLLSTMISQAMLALGAMPDPQTGQRYLILDLAKHHIDMLGVIEEKTKGNLDQEEEEMLTQTLHELRMHFVDVSKAAAEGRLRTAPAPGSAAPGTPGSGDIAGGPAAGGAGPIVS